MRFGEANRRPRWRGHDAFAAPSERPGPPGSQAQASPSRSWNLGLMLGRFVCEGNLPR